MKIINSMIFLGLLISLHSINAEQTDQEKKSAAMQKVLGVAGCFVGSAIIATHPLCRNKFGLNIGVSAALMGMGFSMFDSENKNMWRQMALGAIPLSGVAALCDTPLVSGPNGFVANSKIFSHLAEGGDKYGSAAFKGLLLICAYIGGQSKIQQFEKWAGKKLGI